MLGLEEFSFPTPVWCDVARIGVVGSGSLVRSCGIQFPVCRVGLGLAPQYVPSGPLAPYSGSDLCRSVYVGGKKCLVGPGLPSHRVLYSYYRIFGENLMF